MAKGNNPKPTIHPVQWLTACALPIKVHCSVCSIWWISSGQNYRWEWKKSEKKIMVHNACVHVCVCVKERGWSVREEGMSNTSNIPLPLLALPAALLHCLFFLFVAPVQKSPIVHRKCKMKKEGGKVQLHRLILSQKRNHVMKPILPCCHIYVEGKDKLLAKICVIWRSGHRQKMQC